MPAVPSVYFILYMNTHTLQFDITGVFLSELYTILLEDILVLLQKQDERLVLKFHGKNLASAADSKHIFSPIIKLNTVLVRPVATGKNYTHPKVSSVLDLAFFIARNEVNQCSVS